MRLIAFITEGTQIRKILDHIGVDAPIATRWVVLAALFHGEPATRAGNPGFARGSKPVAEVYTAARAVEWLIR